MGYSQEHLKSVLLIEDDPAQLLEYSNKLRGMGYFVYLSVSAEDALAWIRNHRVDAILTDNVLPGMTGMRSIAEFHKVTQAPVVLMSSDGAVDAQQDALLLGAAAYLQKPVAAVDLASEMKRVSDQSGLWKKA